MSRTLDSSKDTVDSGNRGEGHEENCLDSQLWHACAGGMVQVHKVNSKVYYFPQGHAEHAGTGFEFPPTLKIPPFIPCRVGEVKYLADSETDEVFIKLKLYPCNALDGFGMEDEDGFSENGSVVDVNKPQSFAKTLTQSDANNGGGFSVPRYCAETIFPKLDYSIEPPVQTILAKDVHGEVWKFRHIYRGTPRRHLLTTGWSTYVNQKKLLAGDSIVFLRTVNGELCVGLRRSNRFAGGDPPSTHSTAWCSSAGGSASPYANPQWESKTGNGVAGGGFSMFLRDDDGRLMRSANSVTAKDNNAKVNPKAVIEAANLAAAGQPFEVVYYPRASTPEFCVKASAVNSALRMHWTPGMRFKMAFETEDSSRISWFMGTIASAQFADPIKWPGSPWRLLQVNWDEPDLLQNVKRVSPWLVELVSSIPAIQMSPYAAPRKKLRGSNHPEFPHQSQGILGPLSPGPFSSSMLGLLNPWNCLPDNVPSGIQGARHDHFGITLSDICPDKLRRGLFPNGMYHCHDKASFPSPVSTELHIGSTPSGDLSNSNFSSLLTACSPHAGFKKSISMNSDKRSCKPTQVLLFGKPIGVTSTKSQSSESVHQQQQSQLSDLGCGGITTSSFFSGPLESLNSSQIDNKSFLFQGPHNMQAKSGHGSECLTGFLWFDKSLKLPLENDGFPGNLLDDGPTGHCKVFMESEDVGRSLNLSSFLSYEELYKTLSQMFGLEEKDMFSRVLYRDTNGTVRHTGDEPYCEFMKTAKRVTILSDAGSDNLGR